MPPTIPFATFGEASEDEKIADPSKAPDDDPDDEQLPETPPDVVGMLGFDPAEEEDAA